MFQVHCPQLLSTADQCHHSTIELQGRLMIAITMRQRTYYTRYFSTTVRTLYRTSVPPMPSPTMCGPPATLLGLLLTTSVHGHIAGEAALSTALYAIFRYRHSICYDGF